MNERTETEMLVRTKGASGGPAVSVSSRTEPVLESSEDERERKRRKAQRAIIMARWREKNREHERAYREANKERLKDQLNAWRKANPEKYQAQGKKAYAKLLAKLGREEVNRRVREAMHKRWEEYLAKARARSKAKREKNPDAQRAKEREWRQKYREKIRQLDRERAAAVTPSYVRRLLSNASKLRGVNWPESFVQAYAANIKLKRLWQNQTTSMNSENNS